jgi:uncharacterized protein YndB with AHSA1/START domain
MPAEPDNETAPVQNNTRVERESDRELVITRRFNGPAHLVFKAWTTPSRIQQWWTPKSAGISFMSCDMDVRPGGGYRFVFSHPAVEQPMAFFGTYTDVIPNARLVWTNDEGAGTGEPGARTTVTFEQQGGETLVTMRDLYPSKDALDAAIDSGSTCGFTESFEQLDSVLAS